MCNFEFFILLFFNNDPFRLNYFLIVCVGNIHVYANDVIFYDS